MTALRPLSEVTREAATIVVDIVEKLESAKGVSNDQYTDQPVYHAMADGKQLQLLALCLDANWVSETWFKARRDAAMARLENGRLVFGDRAAWGLGFSYKGLPSDEPYLITTSLVARGFFEASRRVALDQHQVQLATSAYRWIADFIVRTTGPDGDTREIPTFSENEPLRVYNSAAYACALIVQLGALLDDAPLANATERARRALELVEGALQPGFGWPYAAGRPTVDLVHQGYIFNSLAEVRGAEPLAAELLKSLSLFMCSGLCVDKYDLATVEAAIARGEAAASARVLLTDRAGIVFGKPARLWSLGEILVALSRAQAATVHARYVGTVARRLASQLISLYESAFAGSSDDLRQQLHAAHGLAAWLCAVQAAPRFLET